MVCIDYSEFVQIQIRQQQIRPQRKWYFVFIRLKMDIVILSMCAFFGLQVALGCICHCTGDFLNKCRVGKLTSLRANCLWENSIVTFSV